MSYVDTPIRLPNGRMAQTTMPLVDQMGVSPIQGRTPTGQLMSYADTQRGAFPQRASGVPSFGQDIATQLAMDQLWGYRSPAGSGVVPPSTPSFGVGGATPQMMVDEFGFVTNPQANVAREVIGDVASQGGFRNTLRGLGGRVASSATGSGNPGGLLNGVGFRNLAAPMEGRILGRIPQLASGGLGAGLLRGGLYGVAGQLGGGMLEQLADSQGWGEAGDILGSAARFAPLGAPLGLPGIAAMAIGGGLYGHFTGDNGGEEEKPTLDAVKESLSSYVEPLEFARADALVETYKAMGMEEDAAIQQAYAPLIAQVEQGAAQEAEAENILALQMASQSAMAPILAQSNQRLRQFENHMNQLIPTLPENYQNVFRASVPEVAMWQGMMNDANAGAALTAPLADYIRNAQMTGGGEQDYGSALANDPLLSQFSGG